jgi:hypothetical protein
MHAPAADEPTRGEHYRRFDDDGGRLTQARGEQQDANGPEDKADRKDYDRVECARLGRLEHRTRGVVNRLVLSGRLSLENFIPLGKLHPSLLPTSPYVSRGPQPGCIIQRAASDANHAIPRCEHTVAMTLRLCSPACNPRATAAAVVRGAKALRRAAFGVFALVQIGFKFPFGERRIGEFAEKLVMRPIGALVPYASMHR